MMVKHFTGRDETAQIQEYGQQVIMAAADTIINELRCSPISAMCLLFQCAGVGLKEIGGPSADDYMRTFVKTMKAGKPSQQTIEHQMKAFEGMAKYSDLLATTPEGTA